MCYKHVNNLKKSSSRTIFIKFPGEGYDGLRCLSMRICYLAGPKSVHARRWVKYFSEKGYDVHLICYTHHIGSSSLGNVKIHTIKEFHFQIRIISFLINLLLASIQIKKIIKKINPDIIHAHYVSGYGFLSAFIRYRPIIISAWGSDVLIVPKKSRLSKLAITYILKKADLITSVANHITDTLVELGADRKKIITFPMGVDPKQFNQDIKPILRNTQHVVISTRSLNPIYNVELLIRAIPFVVHKISNIKFIIIGEGKQKEELLKLTKRLRVEDYTEFLGALSHDELPRYLISSEVYVSTSLSDGASVSLLEAMACGCFPVVMDIPANREWIIDGKNGFITSNNPNLLAKKIINAIENRALREFAKIKNANIIKKRALWEKNMEKMERYLIQLV